MSCAHLPPPGELLQVPLDWGPMLMIVVDTEEEFPWQRPHDPQNISVDAMQHVHRLHDVVDRFGARPCYVVDYPVASQPQGYRPLLELLGSQRCEIGAHLHPWVNPPRTEELGPRNSYPGNLRRELERDKLAVLSDTIGEAFGQRPQIYKAGRYGIGAHTPGILSELGYQIDLSPTPAFDYSADGGPDFRRSPNDPYWWDVSGGVLCFPCTGAFLGLLRRQGSILHPLVSGAAGRALRAAGVMSRLRLLDRIRLSPEGFTLEEMRRLAGELVRRGTQVLTLSLHSPSLDTGHTPYVRTRQDLRRLLHRIEAFLDYFATELNGTFTTPGRLRQALLDAGAVGSAAAAGAQRHVAEQCQGQQ